MLGDSSGGGTAFSMLLLQQEEGKEKWKEHFPPLVAGVFSSPWLNMFTNTPSYVSNSFCASYAKKEDLEGAGSCRPETELPTPTKLTGDLCYHGLPRQTAIDFESGFNVGTSYAYMGYDIDLLSSPVYNPMLATFDADFPPVQMHVALNELLFSESAILVEKMPAYELHAYDGAIVGCSPFVAVRFHFEKLSRSPSLTPRFARTIIRTRAGMWHDFALYYEGCDKKKDQTLLFAESQFRLISRCVFAMTSVDVEAACQHPVSWF